MSKVIVHLTASRAATIRRISKIGLPNLRAVELLNELLAAYASPDRHCVMCGCTDSRACHGGCSWALKFPASFTGVCSKCWRKFESQVRQVDAEQIEI